jgi:hypothetical protein
MDYAAIAANASASIADAGAPITIVRAGSSGYDPTTSTADASGTKTFKGKAVQGVYTAREIDGTLILQGDSRFYVAVAGIPRPIRDDRLTFASETFRVILTTPVQPGGVPVLWDVQARR